MATDGYKSKLLATLAQAFALSGDQVEELLNDIRSCDDPIFLFPLYEVYKKCKKSLLAWRFISIIADFDTTESNAVLLEIIQDVDLPPGNLDWSLGGLLSNKIINPIISKKIKEIILDIAKKGIESTYIHGGKYIFGISDWRFKGSIDYLVDNKDYEGLYPHLIKIWENAALDRAYRAAALRGCFAAFSEKILDKLIHEYPSFVNTRDELSIARSLGACPNDDRLKDFISLIKGIGSSQAIEIVQESEKSELFVEIESYKRKINAVGVENLDINFAIFAWHLPMRPKPIESRGAFVEISTSLRSMVGNIPDEVRHPFSPDEAQEICQDISSADLNKGLNRLFLFLYSKDKNIPMNLFGLRRLNQLLNLFVHPEAEKKLSDLLEKEGLKELYEESKWQELYIKILIIYKNILQSFLEYLQINKT